MSVTLVPKWAIGGEKNDDDEAPAGYAPSDDNIRVTAHEFATASGAHLLKAVYEREVGDRIRVVYLVGLQAKDGKLITNAVRLASNSFRYVHCGGEAADATALSFSWINSESAANVVVQPGDPDEFAENQPVPCSWTGKLRWVDGVGFRVRSTGQLCKAQPKSVVIDDLGQITTKPRSREDR